tara:strand:- start:527 stop:808 length:282 start_codon:yes stop_codon:yes gene_type:complete
MKNRQNLEWKWGSLDNSIIFILAVIFFFLTVYYNILQATKNISYTIPILSFFAYFILFIFQAKNKWIIGTFCVGVLLLFHIIYLIKIYELKKI